MKKDIEWLKKEIGTEMIQLEPNRKERWSDVKYQTLRSVAQKIYQLDEPEVLSQEESINIVLDDLKEYIKEQQSLSQNVGLAHTSAGNDTHYRQYDYVLECVNEYEPSDDLQNLLIPKQEVLSHDWIDDNTFVVTDEDGDDYAVVGHSTLRSLLVPKKDLPVIPKFVGEFIEEVKASGDRLDDAFSILRGIYHQSKTAEWVTKEKRNSETFARAWLDGYEVEKEQKYFVNILDEGIGAYLIYYPKSGNYGITGVLDDVKGITRFTEQEIKDYDKRYWSFRRPVEGLEE